MIAVIFEVEILEGQQSDYLDFANELKPLLECIEGFISIERFQSLQNVGKILSLSFWEHEDALKEWRNLEQHRLAQQAGRNSIFKNYHLRVGHIIRDYGMDERIEAPTDSQSYHH